MGKNAICWELNHIFGLYHTTHITVYWDVTSFSFDRQVLEKPAAHMFRLKVSSTQKMGTGCSSETPASTYVTNQCHNPAECNLNHHSSFWLWSSGMWCCVIWGQLCTFERTCCFQLLGTRIHGITSQITIILTVRKKSILTSNLRLHGGACFCFFLELPDFDWRRRFFLEIVKKELEHNEYI